LTVWFRGFGVLIFVFEEGHVFESCNERSLTEILNKDETKQKMFNVTEIKLLDYSNYKLTLFKIQNEKKLNQQ